MELEYDKAHLPDPHWTPDVPAATIAKGIAEGFTIHNPTPDKSAGTWAEGMWCQCTLSPTISVLVGWDGLICKAYDSDDESPAGYWRADS